jgi:hypothetical protein
MTWFLWGGPTPSINPQSPQNSLIQIDPEGKFEVVWGLGTSISRASGEGWTFHWIIHVPHGPFGSGRPTVALLPESFRKDGEQNYRAGTLPFLGISYAN